MLEAAKRWARALKSEVVALHLATRDPRTPRLAKFVALAVVVYALSPIDLIPDFIPVLGLLDDLVLVPLGILWAIRLVPPPLMAECRAAAATQGRLPGSRLGAAGVVTLWVLGAAAVAWWALGIDR